uniref:Cytochrome P450 n=1 Tax=Romanomermis culicivorax TaxID=13658 RepID=A0A915KA29_ROMCU
MIDDCAKRMNYRLQEIATNKLEMDAKDEVSSFTMSVIAETLFGIRMDDDMEKAQIFIEKSKKAFEEFSLSNPMLWICFLFPSARTILESLGIGLLSKDCMEFFKSQVLSIIELRRRTAEKSDDFLQLLIDAHANDEANKDYHVISGNKWKDVKKRALTEEEIVANCVLFFLAGFETTSLTVAWIVHLLSVHQDVQHKLFEEIDATIQKNEPLTIDSISRLNYLEQILNETLRLYPVAARTDRVCNENCVVGPYHIPKGMVLNLGIRAVHLDEEYWHEPNHFDPERFSPERKHQIVPYSYFPFGLGPRNCIGMRLALLEVKICVIRLIEEFKILRSPKTEEFPKMKTNVGLTAPINGFWICLDKRN